MEEEEESAERGGGENAHGYMGCVRCSTFVCRECVGAIVSKMDELGLSDEWHNKAKIFLSKGSGGVLSWIDAERTSHCCSLKVADPFPEAKKAWFIPATGEKGRPPPLVKRKKKKNKNARCYNASPMLDGVLLFPGYKLGVCPTFEYVDTISVFSQRNPKITGPLHCVVYHPFVAVDLFTRGHGHSGRQESLNSVGAISVQSGLTFQERLSWGFFFFFCKIQVG